MNILCLHGTGTNTSIFQLQSAALRHELERDGMSFEYAQGGLRCPVAEEIAGMFPDVSDFYTYYDPREADTIVEAEDQLLEMLREREGQFDGILAFSESAALAAALIIRHARENPFKAEGLFRFAIFICGLAPFDHETLGVAGGPLASKPARVKPDDKKSAEEHLINIPTYHVMGSEDELYPYGLALYNCCDPEMAIKTIHRGGHEIPSQVELVKEMTRNINATIQRANFMC
ncbi:uncharacterized protein Triagg1_7169 [Trichoderma aggressivum f. europaeum]|uniref:Serine hydrolase domain-containing protein n=1 Tax=Trichoderma aggressivum f. europaeum TaxID=173218 RepID=A0AAE1J6G6_9HYPO|nr:hypothetical protein Triagg1_7169 [Trichoderma aggressivum f. europaeum]